MRRHRTGPTPEHYPHSLINDHRLGFSAKGVLLDLLARDDNPSLNDLIAEGRKRGQGETRQALARWIQELEEAGYLTRHPHTPDTAPVATDVYDTSQKVEAHR